MRIILSLVLGVIFTGVPLALWGMAFYYAPYFTIIAVAVLVIVVVLYVIGSEVYKRLFEKEKNV